MWNLKEIKDLAIAIVARFVSLNAAFLPGAENITTWLYVTLTGHITIRHFLKEMKAWRAIQIKRYSYSMILPLNYCFQTDVTVLFFGKIVGVERVNSADQINLVVTCTADCTCHHLGKNVYFLSDMWNLKEIRDLPIAIVARFVSLNAVFLSGEKNITTWLYDTLTGHITIRHILEKNEILRSEPKHIVLAFLDFAPNLLFPSWWCDFFVGKYLGWTSSFSGTN